MITNGYYDWNNLAKCVAYTGNRELLNDIINYGANDWTGIACYAAKGGYRDILDDMLAISKMVM